MGKCSVYPLLKNFLFKFFYIILNGYLAQTNIRCKKSIEQNLKNRFHGRILSIFVEINNISRKKYSNI